MEQFSQISTIKRQNFLNSRNQSKQYSELRYSQLSVAIQSQSESMNIEKLLTSMGKRQEPSFELSSINYMPVTNASYFQQRKLNGPGNKNMANSFCMATLNTTNPSLAIQSEPNSMMIGFSSYFEVEQLDYNSKINPLSDYQELGTRKILKFILNFENRNYLMKVSFEKIREFAKKNAEIYVKSLSIRQSGFIELALKKRQDSFWHEKTHEKIGMPYYNKLTGRCAPELVVKKKLQLIQKNVQKFKILKQSSLRQVSQHSQVIQGKYKFAFQILSSPPLHFEKKVNENRNSTVKRK